MTCQHCRHHRPTSGECELLIEGRLSELLENRNPCRPVDFVHRVAHRRRRADGSVSGQASDVAQELLRQVCEWEWSSRSLPRDGRSFFRYLRRALVNGESTWRRRWERRARSRCGACRHFQGHRVGRRSGCGLATIRAESGWRPNPHYGPGKISAHQDPRKLDPGCRAFEGRRRPVSLEQRRAARWEPVAAASKDPGEQAALAEEVAGLRSLMEELARQDLRCAKIVIQVCCEGVGHRETAHRLGICTKTVARDFQRGIEWLREALDPKRSFTSDAR